jgi:hypothetical protein
MTTAYDHITHETVNARDARTMFLMQITSSWELDEIVCTLCTIPEPRFLYNDLWTA